ncbi:cytochrome P450 [Streptomyces sp. URMC 127]|uniref:cytochrome P450 n=1 Tax=Streptomyces sp. URMC 127 TaxID=3423402 RepID=UPI003F1C0081
MTEPAASPGPRPPAASLPAFPGLFEEGFHPDPYRSYQLLREQGPVCPARYLPGSPAWVVTRYAEAEALLRDPGLLRDRRHMDPRRELPTAALPGDVAPYFDNILARRDPPDHTRLRQLVAHRFTAQEVRRLRPGIRAAVGRSADRLAARRPGPADLVAEFAGPLPARVLGELLHLGPDDRDELLVRTGAVRTLRPGQAGDPLHPMVRFAGRLLRMRREQPGDDLVSDLAGAHASGLLGDDELLTLLISLLMAGLDVTANLIGTAVLTLLACPGQWERVRADRALVPQAVEEVLRYRCPLELAARRFTGGPCTVGGVTVPARNTVQIALAAANRDPRRFPDPDRFDIGRKDKAHLAFGHGSHACIGADLGRAETELALTALLDRFPRLQLAVAPERIAWRASFLRAPAALPVRLA